jgi:hypothetical protein
LINVNKIRHVVLLTSIGISVEIFFGLTLFYFPPIFENTSLNIPEPLIDVKLSKNQIQLGESFDVSIIAKNIGDQADIQIVSIGFPKLETTDNIVKITSYNFTQSPHYVQIGDEIGAKYTESKEHVNATYPSIEAYSRPVPQGTVYELILQVMPQHAGIFEVYAKTVAIPHSSDRSHFPYSGLLDFQDEFVQVYSVSVAP